ncbi:MAG: spinster family MFS transporter [Gammaproteobacteria bacterium]
MTLALLFLVAFFNYMDRYMLAVLLPAIKTDLSLSDTQIGFITGVAFTLFYATLGIPIARLADRGSRRMIVSVAMVVWSAMTALCGLATNFAQLAVARVLVGVGEAGATPPSHSLLADVFPKSERGRALSVTSLGAPVGILAGFLLGGWLATAYSWRVALFAVAVPGLLLGAGLSRGLPEPVRGGADGVSPAQAADAVPFRVTMTALLGNATFRNVSIATGLYTVVWLGVVQWLPSFYIRSFGLSLAEVSTWLAFILSGSQIAGMLIGGYLADRLGRRDLRWYAWLPAAAIFCSIPMFVVALLATHATLALLAMFPPFMISIMQGPASFATVQGVADVRMRATAAALMLLITNQIGGIFGAQSVGILSDLLAANYGADSLRYALLIVVLIFCVWASWHYFRAARTIRVDFR